MHNMHKHTQHVFMCVLVHVLKQKKLTLVCVVCMHCNVHTRMYEIIIYVGVDCSEKTPFIQWSKLNDNSSSSYQWGSGSHSNVQWNESLWLFGGYQFPEETSSNDTTLAAPLWRCV